MAYRVSCDATRCSKFWSMPDVFEKSSLKYVEILCWILKSGPWLWLSMRFGGTLVLWPRRPPPWCKLAVIPSRCGGQAFLRHFSIDSAYIAILFALYNCICPGGRLGFQSRQWEVCHDVFVSCWRRTIRLDQRRNCRDHGQMWLAWHSRTHLKFDANVQTPLSFHLQHQSLSR